MPACSASTDATDDRPEQGAFSEAELKFLVSYLDDYRTAVSSASHGGKKKWVKSKPYVDFVKEFKSDQPGGPNLASLLTVL
jgi:hypothetical protein